MLPHTHVCARDEGFGGLTCNTEIVVKVVHRPGSAPFRRHQPHNNCDTHDRCMVPFQYSCTCTRHSHARGRLRISFGRIYSDEGFLFPFSFLQKKNQKTRKGYQVSPAMGGEETGGCMRPVLSYCALPAVTRALFLLTLPLLLLLVLCFCFIILV